MIFVHGSYKEIKINYIWILFSKNTKCVVFLLLLFAVVFLALENVCAHTSNRYITCMVSWGKAHGIHLRLIHLDIRNQLFSIFCQINVWIHTICLVLRRSYFPSSRNLKRKIKNKKWLNVIIYKLDTEAELSWDYQFVKNCIAEKLVISGSL